MKWGIGVDNVDFAACEDLGIPIINTPRMFGGEVADVATAFVIALARELVALHGGTITVAKLWTRPIGAIAAGFIGDRFNREKTLALLMLGGTVSLLAMIVLPASASAAGALGGTRRPCTSSSFE